MRRAVLRFGAAGLILFAGGCVRISPDTKRAYLAPLDSVPGLAAAIASERVVSGRWPREMAELAEAAKRTEGATVYLEQIRKIEVRETDARQARYTFTFAGGGSSTLLVRINLDEGESASSAAAPDR